MICNNIGAEYDLRKNMTQLAKKSMHYARKTGADEDQSQDDGVAIRIPKLNVSGQRSAQNLRPKKRSLQNKMETIDLF